MFKFHTLDKNNNLIGAFNSLPEAIQAGQKALQAFTIINANTGQLLIEAD